MRVATISLLCLQRAACDFSSVKKNMEGWPFWKREKLGCLALDPSLLMGSLNETWLEAVGSWVCPCPSLLLPTGVKDTWLGHPPVCPLVAGIHSIPPTMLTHYCISPQEPHRGRRQWEAVGSLQCHGEDCFPYRNGTAPGGGDIAHPALWFLDTIGPRVPAAQG
ncbi:unnamed protein product [Eretmochelys imbricata]